MLLMMHAVKYGFEQGLSRIEFLGSYEPWLSVWTKNIRAYSMLLHYPPNIHGIRTFSGDLIKTIRSRSSQRNGQPPEYEYADFSQTC